MHVFEKKCVEAHDFLLLFFCLDIRGELNLCILSLCTGKVYFERFCPCTKETINILLDYLFLERNIIMINTCSCMFATTLKQKEVDYLSDALLEGFRLIKSRLKS